MTTDTAGDRTVTDFVCSMYRDVLGREPDAGGFDGFCEALRRGTKQADVLNTFLEGAEFREGERTRCETFLADWIVNGNSSGRFPLDYQPPGEAGRSYRQRVRSGFLDRYCNNGIVLDVGYSGYDNPSNLAALPEAIGVDLNYPGYDGTRLPFDDGSIGTVFSSHCLEHISEDLAVIRDWHRVLKVGGFIVCMVPHMALYEKRSTLPSAFNEDHKRMYTSASLVASFEQALTVNSFRIRHLRENDTDFDYAIGPDQHSDGAYEIELVIEKIAQPGWALA
ncbi:DUF4214 domain-containing protein [Sphingomonas prati]|uniref:SAM-dependent methyltransferase n=1 Tax=Sphingomonas prati TaxID=1843237 RepID=A0A7W9BSH6_9SPHN|nr:DUF4214 domain-containing protein [Sphingomonas prati]MBB5729099.1 SAM-dependent methyltransferase [Sphingomonas prati]GGE85141.1 hypothetical protein GCM10011404_17340 [Sphingomonas prati]